MRQNCTIYALKVKEVQSTSRELTDLSARGICSIWRVLQQRHSAEDCYLHHRQCQTRLRMPPNTSKPKRVLLLKKHSRISRFWKKRSCFVRFAEGNFYFKKSSSGRLVRSSYSGSSHDLIGVASSVQNCSYNIHTSTCCRCHQSCSVCFLQSFVQKNLKTTKSVCVEILEQDE